MSDEPATDQLDGSLPGESLAQVLERSRELGLLGPGSVASHIDHALGFVTLLDDVAPPPIDATSPRIRVLDLGSGGGLPGLVIATHRPDVDLVLLDAAERRTAVLRDAVRRMGLSVDVVTGRAETIARGPSFREQFDVVVARSFGPPAVVAECAVGFLRPEGHLIVSEPASSPDRWPEAPLAEIGLAVLRHADEPRRVVLRRTRAPLRDDVPRRDGRPARRPLF